VESGREVAMNYFRDARIDFQLLQAEWRSPQIGALGSLLAHWTLSPREPALVSLPTGTGKTGVALAAPFLTPEPPQRVLVLVPSTALRNQVVRQFESMRLLREIRALTKWIDPAKIRVEGISGYRTDWTKCYDADVVVAIPQSISPNTESDVSVPPKDMFDLVIVDEAHHLPSETWRGVMNHLEFKNALYLTATPFRLDRKFVPGTRTFYFPMRQAIDELFFKPIVPIILPLQIGVDQRSQDEAIAHEVVRFLDTPEHSSSALLVRAQNIGRAKDLAELYKRRGVNIEVLTSHSNDATQTRIIRRLNSGELRAVSVVGLLGEGFDLPRLRIVAYHDKHKSVPSTVQLIGRLARVNDEFPQDSVLITVNDVDVFPELKGVVRDLYKEDADWARILPGLVDVEIEAIAKNRTFIEAFPESEGEISPLDLRPMPGPVVFEIDDPTWSPFKESSQLPPGIRLGDEVSGAMIIAAFATEDGSLVAFVTRNRTMPRWSLDVALASVEYALNLVSFRRAPNTDMPSLLFVDVGDTRFRELLFEVFEVPDTAHKVTSERLDGYLQSLPRTSVSSIGMRNILASTRGTTYKTRAGSSTDSDLLSTETTQTSLGHVMMQVDTSTGSATMGAAFEKGRIWQSQYKTLVDYATWISDAARLLWFPTAGSPTKLLPQISRGRNLESWPTALPIAIEMNPALSIGGYQIDLGESYLGGIEDFELFAEIDPTGQYAEATHTSDLLFIFGVLVDRANQTSRVIWRATLSVLGEFRSIDAELAVMHGYQDFGTLSTFLSEYPPLIYFLNGQATQGSELFDVQGGSSPRYDSRNVLDHDWIGKGVDILAETRATATTHALGKSIHEEFESYLLSQPRTERYRWIIFNDGAGEVADYIVVEWSRRRPVRLSLWHVKAAGGKPGLRIDDFQVVVAQAMRSRRRFNDPTLWETIRSRLRGQSSPRAELVPGSDGLSRLLVLLGEKRDSGANRLERVRFGTTLVHGEIGVVQPGLSTNALNDGAVDFKSTTKNSLHQLFGILNDTVAVTGNRAIILGSP
jgi:superfamily II DNA or RNA helicase